MRADRGQASVDYLALLGVLVLVMAAAAGLGVDPSGVGGAVSRGLHRGLCIVRGGACDADTRPCVVRAEKVADESHLELKVARIGRGRYLLRERRSDGSYAITDFHEHDARLGGGKRLAVKLGSRTMAVRLSASGAWRHGRGATYTVETAQEAEAMERLLRAGARGLPAPAETFGRTRTTRDYGASVTVGGPKLGVGFRAEDQDEVRTARDGSRTVTIAHREEWSANVLGWTPAGAGAGDEAYTIRLDPAGRPLELIVGVAGTLEGAASLPGSVAPVAGHLLAPAGRQRTYVVEAHLDLADPANAVAAGSFVDEIRRPRVRIGAAPAPEAALRARIAEAATIEGRVYAVQERGSGDPESLGLGGSTSVERVRLLTAVSRGIDGAWRRRDDCLA